MNSARRLVNHALQATGLLESDENPRVRTAAFVSALCVAAGAAGGLGYRGSFVKQGCYACSVSVL